MDENARRKREAEIYRAAYDLLARHGYGATSMLRIAKAAKASNETLYRWYGDKDGLFKAMVRDNAAETRRMLSKALDGRNDPWATLEGVAPIFLRMILGDRAILLNRAAAADPSGALGAAISAGGRREIMPLLDRVMHLVCDGAGCDPRDATEWFLSLLIGDLQIKRVINESAAYSREYIDRRCERTLATLRRLIDFQNAGPPR